MSLLPNQTNINQDTYFFLKANVSTLNVNSISTGSLSAGIISSATANISSLDTNFLSSTEAFISTISTTGVDIDGQLLTANPTELLLNGIPLATTSNLSSIGDWALEPAVSTVQMAGNNLIGANLISTTSVVATNIVATNILANNIFALSTYTSTISSLAEICDFGFINQLSAGQAFIGSLSAPIATIEAVSTLQVEGLSSVNGFPFSSLLNPTSSINLNVINCSSLTADILTVNKEVHLNPQFPSGFVYATNILCSSLSAIDGIGGTTVFGNSATCSTLKVTGTGAGGVTLSNTGSILNTGALQTGAITNPYSVSGSSNYFANPTTIGDTTLFNAGFVVNGACTLDGGTTHGTTIGCLPVLGVNTVRIDVLPIGTIDLLAPGAITVNAGGAGNFACGGALSLAGGGYVEINTGELQCVNTTSGESLVSMNHLQGNTHNGGSGKLYITDLSSINGFPIEQFQNSSTISTFQSLTTSTLRLLQTGSPFTLSSLIGLSTAGTTTGTSSMVTFNTDISLGVNDIYCGQIRLSGGLGATSAEVLLTSPDGGVQTIDRNTGDRTLRTRLGANNAISTGYILDTYINPPFFSTINGSTNMMAYFPSTTASTIGISTVSVLPQPYYALSAYASSSTTVAGANIPTVVQHNASSINVGGFTVAPSTLTVPVAGLYEITTSLQFATSSGGTNEVEFWFRKNGGDLADSASRVSVVNNGDTLGTISLFDRANANDTYSVVMASGDNNMTALWEPAQTPPPFTRPSIPAIITNIKRLSP